MSLKLPKGLISPEKAKELNQQFINTRSNDLNSIVEKLDKKPKKKDALSSWFSLEEIKNYIAYIESKAPDASGLRVYFGAYGTKEYNIKKSNISTVFFVPTRLVSDASQDDALDGGENSDIDDLEGLNNGVLGDPPSAKYPQ